jgi:hypothetical protein
MMIGQPTPQQQWWMENGGFPAPGSHPSSVTFAEWQKTHPMDGGTGASPNAPGWLQGLLAGQNPLNPPSPQAPSPAAQGQGMGFEQQLQQHGGYNTPPAQNQNPWLQGQQGINPQLQAMLSNLPPRPTGLPPGMMSTPPPQQPGQAPGQPPLPPGMLTGPGGPTQPNANDHGINSDHTNHQMGGTAGTGSGFGFGKDYMDLGRVGNYATHLAGFAGPAFGALGAGVRGFVNANNVEKVNQARMAQGLAPLSGWERMMGTLGLNGIGSRTGGLANRGAPTSSGMDAAAGSRASKGYTDRMSDRTGGSGGGGRGLDHAGGGHTNGQDKDAAGRDAARN